MALVRSAAGRSLSNPLALLPAAVAASGANPSFEDLRAQIEPGHDEFPEEKRAAELVEALHTFVRSGHETTGQLRRALFFPLADGSVRFEITAETAGRLIHRVGRWQVDYRDRMVRVVHTIEEHRAESERPWFRDITAAAFEGVSSFAHQLSRGIPYWRSRLDPASGIDIYGSNGVAVGDVDGDGEDELFICQPGGLPNRLFKFKADGRLDDITEQWEVALLDDTSCALFLDLRNSGRQDLVVLRAAGPTLYINEGHRYRRRDDAFRFARRPRGGFTGMSAADYDRDGKLDVYLCSYVYFLSEAQYTYPAPYHDAQNGPPNFLFHNALTADGSGTFEDRTEATGLDRNNTHFSFAPAWCDYNGDGWPDLYVANDFGRNNLYRNHEGKFTDVAREAGVEDLGPGMSAAWFDADRDGRPDLYVADMWTDVGQRVAASPRFTPAQAGTEFADAYRSHMRGNALYRNMDRAQFVEAGSATHCEMGRWAWSAGGHDLNNDGRTEIFITCGMLTNANPADLMSFFWRQVVAKSPVTATGSAAYERGWNALNQFLREDYSWSGHQPNILYAWDGTRYQDVSGVSGLDFADDSRAFAVTDLDGDGRPDLIVKSRLGPQVRILLNQCTGSHHSVGLRLQGTTSNRGAIGAKVEADGQTKWVEAGSGFLSQHSKRLLFGLGERDRLERVEVTWPSGTRQRFGPLEAGFDYELIEGQTTASRKPFRRSCTLPEGKIAVDNSLELEETWFLSPVPLPDRVQGPALLILKGSEPVTAPAGVPVQMIDVAAADRRAKFEIFRRYLFDWRTKLVTPLALLLDENGQVRKVYATVPDSGKVRADLALEHPPALPFAGSYVRQPRRDVYKWGAAYLNAGDTEHALPYLEAVLEQTPDNPRVLLLVGQIHLRAGRLQNAHTALERALTGDPQLAEAWRAMGGLYQEQQRLERALQHYERAAELKPDLTMALLDAGQAADKLGRHAQAEQFYRRALTAQPESAEAANGLGLALAKQGKADAARQAFEQAIAKQRDYAGAINNLGVLYLETGKVNDAIAAFAYGIRVAPDDDMLYLNLGRTYARLGELDRARQTMQQLLDRKPQNDVARRALEELARP